MSRRSFEVRTVCIVVGPWPDGEPWRRLLSSLDRRERRSSLTCVVPDDEAAIAAAVPSDSSRRLQRLIVLGQGEIPRERSMEAAFGGNCCDSFASRVRALQHDGWVTSLEHFSMDTDSLDRWCAEAEAADLLVLLATAVPSERELETIQGILRVPDHRKWLNRDAWHARRMGGRASPMRFGLGPVVPGPGEITLYHGCPGDPIAGEGDVLRCRERLWASPSRAFAACFGLEEVRNGTFLHGLDLLGERPTFVISGERADLGASMRNRTASLHRVRAQGGDAMLAGACLGLEVSLGGRVVVEEVERGSVAELLARYRIALEGAEDGEGGSLDEFGIAEAVWIAEFGATRHDVGRFSSLRRAALTWLPEHLQRPPSRVKGHDPAAALQYLRRVVLPELGRNIPAGELQGHGERHAWVVANLALLVAIEEDVPPVTVAVAGALHDEGRADDAEDPGHALRGAVRVGLRLDGLRSLRLGEAGRRSVIEAIRGHSLVGEPEGPVGACLRDADRLGLAWERGFDSRYFATASGRRLARGGPDLAEVVFRERFGRPLFDSIGWRVPRDTWPDAWR